MNFEEMQSILQQMLAVQQNLQAEQVEFKQSLVELREGIAANRVAINELRISVSDLKEVSVRHERRIQQLIGYSITGESERLDVIQRLQNLERRITKIEQNNPTL